MDTTTLLMSQLTDIFRIGLLAGLILTMERTRAQTGVVLPIVAGIVFIAVIIPATQAWSPTASSPLSCGRPGPSSGPASSSLFRRDRSCPAKNGPGMNPAHLGMLL
jgi:hypothetical protein